MALFTTILLFLVTAHHAQAQNLITVNSADDSGMDTLRQAIIDAAPGDIIVFDPSVTSITLTSGELLIDKDLTIDGSAAPGLVISGNNASRIFNIDSASPIFVSISNLTVADGVDISFGGAILNASNASTTLTHVTVRDSVAGDGNFGGQGGGIFNAGELTLFDSTISNNHADGSFFAGSGGGIYTSGSLFLYGSTVDGNSADSSDSFGGNGGGIYTAASDFNDDETLIIASVISNNSANGSTVGGQGGGIFNAPGDNLLALVESSVMSNTITGPSSQGGGIYNGADSSVVVMSSTVGNNEVNGEEASGGGIYNNAGFLDIMWSTVSNNQTIGVDSTGGGISHAEASNLGMTAIFVSTVSGNSADTEGGGLYIGNDESDIEIWAATFSGNSATSGGGIATGSGASFLLGSSILNNSTTGGDCVGGTADFGSIDNVISDAINVCGLQAGDNNLLGTDPQLGPLANNTSHSANATFTHALLPTSPAIDHSTNCGIEIDQRGISRFPGPTCDSGAYEFQALANLTVVKTALPQDGTDFDFTITNSATPNAPIVVAEWGGILLIADLFYIKSDAGGNIYAPSFTGTINKFDNYGTALARFIAEPGLDLGPLYSLAIDDEGNVYIPDPFNNRIIQIDSDGNFVRMWGWDVDAANPSTGFEVCTVLVNCQWGTPGDGEGQFDGPNDIALDDVGNLYVTEFYNNRVSKFNLTETTVTFERMWGADVGGAGDDLCLAGEGCQAGNMGDLGGQFHAAEAIALDAAGNVYVTDYLIDRVQKFDSNGTFLAAWGWDVDSVNPSTEFEICTIAANCQSGVWGDGEGQLNGPLGIALDVAGNIYIVDSYNNRVQVFDSNFNYIRQWGTEGGDPGQFDEPIGITLDSQGNIFVSDYFRIQKFLASGFMLDDAAPDDSDGVSNSITFNRLPIGEYTISELVPADWDLSAISCVGNATTEVVSGNSVTVTLGLEENVICTFNNRKQGDTTFEKVVLGGTATPTDWTFDIAGGPQGVLHNQPVTLITGVYTVTEAGPANYTLTAAGGACALVNGTIELTVTPIGGTCTITNTRDTGAITFIKTVIGGTAAPTDWAFDVAGGPQGVLHNQPVTVDTGVYTVTETGPADHTLTAAAGACALVNGNIELTVTTAGGTCTITNTRNTGSITFAKTVIGGTAAPTDWTFDVAGGPLAVAHNQTVTLDTGVYAVTENGPADYTITAASGACALVNGGIELTATSAGGTCTITNTRDIGAITFVKTVIGGTAAPEEWSFDVAGGPQAVAHNQTVTMDTGLYTVTETGPAGYAITDATGACALVNGSIELTVTSGGGICTITNTRQTGQVTFIKQVLDGTAAPADWSFDVTGGPQAVAHNQTITLDTGVYTVTEAGPAGYTLVGASGACQLVNGTIELTVTTTDGTCTVTNSQAALQFDLPQPFQLDEAALQAASVNATSLSYTIRLATAPTGDVEILISGGEQYLSITPTSLRFTPTDWDQPQTVTLSSIDNLIDQGDSYTVQIIHTVQSSDPAYAALPPLPATVTIIDDDTAGVQIIPNNLSIEVGQTGSYQVVLTSQPTAPVYIDLSLSGDIQTNATCDPSTPGTFCLLFTPENWNQPQTVVINALGRGIGLVVHTLRSTDPFYAAQASANVSITLLDSPTANPEEPEPNLGNLDQTLYLPLIRK